MEKCLKSGRQRQRENNTLYQLVRRSMTLLCNIPNIDLNKERREQVLGELGIVQGEVMET